MLQRLIECIIYILAVYGLLILVLEVAALIRKRIAGYKPEARIVLLVRNAEECIEYVVRNMISKEMASGYFFCKDIVIVDMDSSDHTYKLLEKLQKDFPNIEVLSYQERELIFDNFPTFSPSKK